MEEIIIDAITGALAGLAVLITIGIGVSISLVVIFWLM